MKKNGKRALVAVSAGLILTTSAFTSGFAANAAAKLQAIMAKEATIVKENKVVSLGKDEVTGQAYYPVYIDNRLYVPVRAMSEVLGMEVGWNGQLRQVSVKPTGVQISTEELFRKDMQIIELQSKVSELEGKLKTQEKVEKEKEESKLSIRDLENELNKKFDVYRGARFDLRASGNQNSVTVDVAVRKDYMNEWNRLDDREVKSYAEDIYSFIKKEYKDAKIVGYIEGDRDSTYVEFGELRGRFDATVKLGKSTPTNGKFEQDLNDKYRRDLSDLRHFNLKLDVGRDYIDINIDVYEDEWLKLSSKTRNRFFDDVIYDVEREYKNSKATVYIKDGNRSVESSR